ncbi:MAG: type II toxin-antitoxin system HicB family antitoxin [Methanobacteriota archaeon]|nr:MAG: type II toxin-antitoxin system HicB family antitoxin [Euryarchaeota archaeon]
MLTAVYRQLDDGSYAGKIPGCKGVIAFGQSRRECRQILRAKLESWILLNLKLGHPLPIIHGINLNKEPLYDHVYSM